MREKREFKLQPNGKQLRGFACMTIEARTKIARQGGTAVSKKRGWMKLIGKLGGKRSHSGSRKAA